MVKHAPIAMVLAMILVMTTAIMAEARPAGLKKPDAIGIVEQSLQPGANLFVILTGDGGWWGDLEARIGLELAHRGFAVIGIDTNRWFDKMRTPDEWAGFLGKTIDHYQYQTKASRVFLIGWSYGANVLPIGYNRLSPAIQQQVAAMVMLAPEATARLQVTLAGRMGLVAGDLDLDPEMARMPADRLFCLIGAGEEKGSGCYLPGAARATRLIAPGGIISTMMFRR